MLKKHPKINVIVTFNEWTTLGVGYAIQELGLKDNVRVVAFDSNVVSVGMLETGEVDTPDRTEFLCHGVSRRGDRLQADQRIFHQRYHLYGYNRSGQREHV